jgi:hypothetical protein
MIPWDALGRKASCFRMRDENEGQRTRAQHSSRWQIWLLIQSAPVCHPHEGKSLAYKAITVTFLLIADRFPPTTITISAPTFNMNAFTFNMNAFTFNFIKITVNMSALTVDMNALTIDLHPINVDLHGITFNMSVLTFNMNVLTVHINAFTFNMSAFTFNINALTFNMNALAFNMNKTGNYFLEQTEIFPSFQTEKLT